MIIGIVAIARNFAIGKNGKLPWHYTEDLKFFKRTTMGSAIAMGSTTWRSIGRPLPGRLNIVLSRKGIDISGPGVLRLKEVDQVTELSRYLRDDVYIIGGASVYQSFNTIIDEWLVTDIPLEVPDADTFMPVDFLDGFSEVERIGLPDGLTVRRLRRNG